MTLILPRPRYSVKQRFLKHLRQCRQALVRTRYLVILNVWNGRSARDIQERLHIHNTTVYRIVERFRKHGEAALGDGRENNGCEKLAEHYLAELDRVVRSNAQEHGWRRPTWTREMLVQTMRHKTGVRIHVATMSRALDLIKARRANPRPRVRCPWFPAVKTRRMNEIRRLLATLPRWQAAVYEDEVDIHLNPKIGLDWMGRGQQKEALTPGQNEKRYLAGAQDVRTGVIHWVEADKKDSWLFLEMLHKLTQVYAQATVIHVILDNYKIHSSQIAQLALAGFAARVKLHFLPHYSPDENVIERTWQDLHANVTRNHTCARMQALMQEVRYYLRKRNRKSLQASVISTPA